jgi:hypothetical protein
MSLPIWLDTQEHELWTGQYIFADPDYIKKWDWVTQDHINSCAKTVGIRWTGNPAYEHDLHREIPLKDVYDLVCGIVNGKSYNLISLQKGEGADDVVDYSEILDIQHKLESFEDTLAVIDQLDFVITSCTSIAHAAAAMDKLTFILVPITAYYVWASPAETDVKSIWYGKNVRILRQTVQGSWKEPIEQLKTFLKEIKNGPVSN